METIEERRNLCVAIVDSHCHLSDYEDDVVDNILKNMTKTTKDRGTFRVVSVAVDINSSMRNLRIAKRYKEVVPSVGVHPWFSSLMLDQLKMLPDLVRNISAGFIGEIGLDYEAPCAASRSTLSRTLLFPPSMPQLPSTPPDAHTQQEVFLFQLQLSQENGLPVNLHWHPSAHKDMIDILRNSGEVKGIIHGFFGTLRQLRDFLDLGFYISIGPQTFELNECPLEIIRYIPLDRFLLETDANPSLMPNGPLEIFNLAERVAHMLDTPLDVLGGHLLYNLGCVLTRK